VPQHCRHGARPVADVPTGAHPLSGYRELKQTRKASLAESFVNVAVGYGLSVATTAVVLPLFFAIYIPLGSNLEIGLIFTIISIARSFVLRRLFEAFRVRGGR
jgi:hypothetical protein